MSQTADELIYLVQNDDLPRLYVQVIDDETSLPLDLSDGTTVITGSFRERGTLDTLFSQEMEKTNGGEDGMVTWDWPENGLDDLDVGRYEGELSFSFDSEIQTVVNKLKFKLIEKFAAMA